MRRDANGRTIGAARCRESSSRGRRTPEPESVVKPEVDGRFVAYHSLLASSQSEDRVAARFERSTRAWKWRGSDPEQTVA